MLTAVSLQHHSHSHRNSPAALVPSKPSPSHSTVVDSPPARQTTQRHLFAQHTSMATSSPARPPAANDSPTNEERAAAQALQDAAAQSRPLPIQQASTSKPSSNPLNPNVPLIKRETSPELARSGSKQSPSSRHRPRRLDLSNDRNVPLGRPSAGLPSKDSGALSAMNDVGIACLSPGFQTQDPLIQQNIQRSMDLRDQQRQIIEARLHKNANSKDAPFDNKTSLSFDNKSSLEPPPLSSTFGKVPGSSKRKGPPPGLSIHAPSAHHFATEPRVIQSAPLHQSFTGLRPSTNSHHPLSRQIVDQHQYGPTSHTQIPQLNQLAAAASAANRLPPIQDVIHNDEPIACSSTLNRRHSSLFPNPADHSKQLGPMHSPSFPLPPRSAGLHPPPSLLATRSQETFTSSASSQHDRDNRPHESTFRSADEAVQSLSHGLDENLPKIVHYGGHQPPTPPSPLMAGQPGYRPPLSGYAQIQHPNGHGHENTNGHSAPPFPNATSNGGFGTARRRTREEFEEDGASAPGADEQERERERERRRAWEDEDRRMAAGMYYIERQRERDREEERGRDGQRKKEEFIALVSRAWDLWHS